MMGLHPITPCLQKSNSLPAFDFWLPNCVRGVPISEFVRPINDHSNKDGNK